MRETYKLTRLIIRKQKIRFDNGKLDNPKNEMLPVF